METTVQSPVKGLVWKHATRTNWRREPLSMIVTSVNVKTGTVYSRDEYRNLVKTPVGAWERYCAEVVSMPEPVTKEATVKLSAAACRALHERAHEAGMAAGKAAMPEPMVVFQRENPFDDTSRVTKVYEPVMDGVCGFAYVTVRPGNSTYARWLKANAGAFKAYYGGVQFSVGAFNQSLTRKTAYADAYCAVARAEGVKATTESRMD